MTNQHGNKDYESNEGPTQGPPSQPQEYKIITCNHEMINEKV